MKFAAALLLAAAPVLTHAQNQWVLTGSTVTWHVTHPMHEVAGTSHGAKGKGNCAAGQCAFLVAVPLNTFDSGDSNRDLHMLQVTRGAQFPMVVVRTRVPQAELSSPVLNLDLQIQFSGQTADYKQVRFERVTQGNEVRITGTIPGTLSDFKIQPPTLLTMLIKNEMPVHVDLTWRPQ